MTITYSDIDVLIEKQRELNSKFSVTRWDQDIVETALISEYGEFIAEIPTIWKVWKKTEDNIPAAKVEFIDCVHFMLSLIILRKETDSDGVNITVNGTHGFGDDFIADLNSIFKKFLDSRNSLPISRYCLMMFVDEVTSFFGMSRDEFFGYFETKKKINEERASGGYLTGDYTKKECEAARFEEIVFSE